MLIFIELQLGMHQSGMQKLLKHQSGMFVFHRAEENFNCIKNHVEQLVDDTENLNCMKMWELKNCSWK